MTEKLKLSCECGAIKGTMQIKNHQQVSRVICHCRDCQSFAHTFGKPDKILNRCAGTDIYQISPSDLSIDEGKANLACLRLTPNGIIRWYSSCCNTPLANTPKSPSIPFVGLLVANIKPDQDGQSIDDALGPIDYRIHGRHMKKGDNYPKTHRAFPLSMLMSIFRKVISRRIKGEHKKSPFFNPETMHPLSEPKILSSEERQDIADRVNQWSAAS